jgi:hypothetical protein
VIFEGFPGEQTSEVQSETVKIVSSPEPCQTSSFTFHLMVGPGAARCGHRSEWWHPGDKRSGLAATRTALWVKQRKRGGFGRGTGEIIKSSGLGSGLKKVTVTEFKLTARPPEQPPVPPGTLGWTEVASVRPKAHVAQRKYQRSSW